jgi:hypothetical protein
VERDLPVLKPQIEALVKRLEEQGYGGEVLSTGYGELLENLKSCILTAKVQAALAVNRELVLLYWDIDRSILERQQQEGWGAKVIERLADACGSSFPI